MVTFVTFVTLLHTLFSMFLGGINKDPWHEIGLVKLAKVT